MKLMRADIIQDAFPVSLLYRNDDGDNHRRSVTPDDDISDLPQDAHDAISAHWAGMDMADWDAAIRPPGLPVTAADIKAEAERRILKVLPEWQQRNHTARAVELVVSRLANGNWTPAEAAEAQAIQAQWDRIKSIRARSGELEQNLPADFANNANWPT